MLLLRIYFESDEDEALQNLIASFKIYLQRNKLLAEKKHKRYYNLFRFTLKLHNIYKRAAYNKKEKSKAQLKKLNEQILANNYIVNKSWLLNQLKSIGIELNF